jgi:ketosteroid isomerase-like protein
VAAARPQHHSHDGEAGGVYLSSQLIALEARRNGYAEGIALDTDGNLSEGSAENLFLARDGVLFTPPRSASILAGITRDSVMTLARDMGIEVREEALPREALYTADEIFFTGTAAEVTPVRSVDRKRVGDGSRGPMTAAIQRAFFGLFDGTTRDAWGWLEPVAPDSGQSPPPAAAIPLAASTPPEAAEMREDIVTNLFEIIDSRRWDELGACFHPEVVYQRPGHEPIVGVDRLLHFYRHERVIASGEHRLEAVVAQDGHMACWGRFVGVGRDGAPIDEAFADTYVLSDGRIRARKSFFYRPAI